MILTEVDCQKIVRHSSHIKEDEETFEILNFSVENFGNYLGFLGEYYRLKIDIKAKRNANVDREKVQELFFFVKTLPREDEEKRNMLIRTGIFGKEVRIFREIIPKLVSEFKSDKFSDASWCPKAHLIRDDMLIFNDLSHEGYQMLPFRFQFTREHVEVTLSSLARFHTCSLAYEVKGNSIVTNFSEILFETSIADIPWYHAGLKAIATVAREKIHTSEGRQPAVIDEHFYEKMFESIEMMETSPIARFPRVLSHRDVWKNNLMFKLDCNNRPQHCVLVDFQTARYLPISIDVMMAIVCTVSRATREEHFIHFLQFYYQQLALNMRSVNIELETLMTFDDFRLTCEYHSRVLLIYRCILLMITTIPEYELAKLSKEEIYQFCEVDKSEIVLKIMKNDVDYEKSLVEAVYDVIENIAKS